jgi:hypothetical protein
LTTRKYPNVINVLFVLAVVGVEVESGCVSHVTPGLIGHNGDIVAYLVLIRIAFERVERIAHRDVS